MGSGAKSMLASLFDSARTLAQNLIEDFKRSGPVFRKKFFAILAYVVIAIFTLAVFPPPGELNQIGAEVRQSRTVFVGGRYFLVINRSQSAWKNVRITLNDTYRAVLPLLAAEKKKAVFFHQFRDPGGKPPPQNIVPQKLRIDCQLGSFERDYRKYREE